MAGLPRPDYFPRSARLSGGLGQPIGAPGPLSAMPGSLLGAPETLYVNGRDIETTVNGRIVQGVRAVADGSSGTLHDLDSNLDPSSVHFGSVSEETSRKYAGPRGRVLLHDAPRNLKSISQSNFYLKSIPGRVRYGGLTDVKQLADEFVCEGVLQTYDEPQNANNRAERVVSMAIAKRVRVPDFWAAEGNVAPEAGCKVYFVWQRHTLDEDEKARQPSRADDGKANPAFDDFKHFQSHDTTVPNTYWQVHCIRMAKGDPAPSCMLYVTSKWLGTCRYFGRITNVFYNQHSGGGFQSIYAQKALFPEFEDPECHRKEAVCLHEIEVMVDVQ